MGRYGIDYVSVKEAAEQLAAAGDAVTVEKIRHALGSGSFTTLGRHLRTWRRTQDPAVGQSDAMPEMINDAAQAVWSNLSRAAEERVVQAQEAAQTAVAAAQDAAQEQLAAAKKAHSETARTYDLELQHLQSRYDERCAELTASLELQQRTEAERQAAALEGARATAELGQMRQHLRDQSQEVARLTAGLERAEAQLAAREQALSQAQHAAQQQHELFEAKMAETQAGWQEQQRAWQSQVAREQQEVDRLRVLADRSETVLQQLQALESAEAQSRAQQNLRQERVAAQLEALDRQAAETFLYVQAVRAATQEQTIGRLFAVSQASAESRYQNLMGAIVKRAEAHDKRS